MINQKTFLKTVSKALKINNTSLHINLNISDIENWDSLTVINIIINLKKGGIKVPDNLSNLKSLKELYDKINKIN
jgi:acyl carrier protein